MPTSVIAALELSPDVIGTKRDNAKSDNRVKDLEKSLEHVRSVEQLACVNFEMARSRKDLGALVKNVKVWYAKLICETVQ